MEGLGRTSITLDKALDGWLTESGADLEHTWVGLVKAAITIP